MLKHAKKKKRKNTEWKDESFLFNLLPSQCHFPQVSTINSLVDAFPKCIVIDINRHRDRYQKRPFTQALNDKLYWNYFSGLISKQEYRLTIKSINQIYQITEKLLPSGVLQFCFSQKKHFGDFPGSLAVRTLSFYCSGWEFDPWSGN